MELISVLQIVYGGNNEASSLKFSLSRSNFFASDLHRPKMHGRLPIALKLQVALRLQVVLRQHLDIAFGRFGRTKLKGKQKFDFKNLV